MDPKLPQNQKPDPSVVQNPVYQSQIEPKDTSKPDGKDPVRFQKMMAVGGHPEMGHHVPASETAKSEQNPNVEQIKKAFDKGKTVEVGENLNLKKEVLKGVEEVHDHEEDEPIELPSLLSDVVTSSVPLPPGAMMQKDTHVTLPLNQMQMKTGLRKSVQKSIRWLAEWCVKQLKEAHHLAKQHARL